MLWLTHAQRTEYTIRLQKSGKVKVDTLRIVKEVLWVGMQRIQITWDRKKKRDDVNIAMKGT